MNSIQLILTGQKISPRIIHNEGGFEEYEVLESFELNGSRSEDIELERELDENIIVRLTTEDGLEWFGFADDLMDLHGDQNNVRSGDTTVYRLPSHLKAPDGQRGIFKFLKNKFLDLIRFKSSSSYIAQELGLKLDKSKNKNPGLHHISRELTKEKKTTSLGAHTKYLIMIHGFFNTVEGSFENFDNFDEVWNLYQGNILGFDHFTISQSPIRNAIDLLDSLPTGGRVDLLSQSRGGLVADMIARCDVNNPIIGFTDAEISQMESHGHKTIASEMKELRELAERKRLSVGRVVRVACPASGTLMLSKRLDFFLNIFLNALSFSLGPVASTTVGLLKKFTLDVLQQRFESKDLPGMWAQVPSSEYQKLNNNDFELNNDLVSIAGDADFGGSLFNSIKVVVFNLLMGDNANDMVNDTAGQLRGLPNRNSHWSFRYESKNFSHFKYFNTPDTNLAIRQGLKGDTSGMIDRTTADGSRGAVLSLFNLKEIHKRKIGDQRDVLIVIPGIMGSSIYQDEEYIWVNLEEICRGRMTSSLDIDSPAITTPSVPRRFYGDFVEYFQKRYDVLLFPFDWRKSVDSAARDLEQEIGRLKGQNRNIRIAAHSMGGLVARSWMSIFSDSWETLQEAHDGRLILFGTPWRGSHLITEVLTGESRRVKQLARIDVKNSKFQLLKTIQKYPGIYNLLPMDAEELLKAENWNELYEQIGIGDKMSAEKELIKQHFESFRKQYGKFEIQENERIIYIAGWSPETTDGYYLKRNFFGKNKIQFTVTSEGDGSVTWKSGIPSDLHPDNLYYTLVGHSDLMAADSLHPGVEDLIEKGTTRNSKFKTSKIRKSIGRGQDLFEISATTPMDKKESNEDYFDLELAYDRIYGVVPDQQREAQEEIQVDVFNGDLKWSRYPVLAGHFGGDGIVSAERAIDIYIGGKLQERHDMDFYPGRIGEQAVIYDPKDSPCGALIVGLGRKNELSGYLLSKTVEKGILKYAIFFRDNFSTPEHEEICQGISCLLVGSAYGRLPMQESIRAILMGIQNANRIIRNTGPESKLKPIKHLEFVDYYKDNAYECFKVLKSLDSVQNNIHMTLSSKIIDGFGQRERLLRDDSRSWWQSFTTEVKRDEIDQTEYLAYSSYSGLANVSKQNVYSDLKLAEYLATELSTQSNWNNENSKAIFELLIPNAYKDFVRNHRNIEWKMDIYTAQFPWEMFHDFNFGSKPTFTESGLIRQLIIDNAEINPALVSSKTALVIGDPVYLDLPQLNGALEESRRVHSLLQASGFDVKSLLRSKPLDIIKSLYASKYKILHIAAHGLFDIEEGKVGIAIGDGQLLSPGTIRQLSSIPEFVFINCCYSGTTDPDREEYTHNRNRLAANVGTQLIKMGVKAVVVAGWAVDDQAALFFADTLYDYLLRGYYFGDAVKNSRSLTYEKYQGINTWGAYQCYGDQFYRLHRIKNNHELPDSISLKTEILLELRNVNSRAQNISVDLEGTDQIQDLFDKTSRLIDKANTIEEYGCEIQELEGMIYMNLGKYRAAGHVFDQLLKGSCIDYSLGNILRVYNIKSKDLTQRMTLEENLDAAKSKAYREKILELIHSIELIEALGVRSAEFYSTLASTYKRMALIRSMDASKSKETDSWDLKSILELARKHYRKAASLNGENHFSSVYFITSAILLQYLINGKIDQRQNVIKGMNSKSYLKHWIDEIQDSKVNRNDNWSQLIPIQLLKCIYVTDQKVMDIKPEGIMSKYENLIKRSISAKDLIGEIEHLDFIVRLLPNDNKSKMKKLAIEKIKNKLNQYISM